ncbi:MAG: 3-hydroxyacyl-CoA dehydrogenase family protein [Lentimicrobiaceae bacterium]|nr:3-hydroxyacyl-CoA dehydrogenase family protein [Lentimicrobiaceae bacterium]MCO5265237.1 3-hydroxyacyl-CoA dehydrogenase family protein [Lentimicrobium sp.]
MNYTERLSNVTVLGAAGKMGSGILLLTALEAADQMLQPANKDKHFVINAVDVTSVALPGLMKYIRAQVLKAAEKKTVLLRNLYAERKDLIENGDIIDAYVNDVMSLIRPGTRMEVAYESTLVFEAVSENAALKTKLFRQINENNPNQPWFFTNTSSVPIGGLNQDAALDGRILGFHFYNPPAVQKLVELITIEANPEGMKEFALQLAKNMRKVIVSSNDIAGFIGNGHFMRDAIYAIQEASKLSSIMPLHEAVYVMNKISQDYLMRPMGIFQLIDYVGVDVVRFILNVMNPYMPDEDLHSALLDELFAKEVKGGQFSDGSQKDGFLKYEKGRPVAVYCAETAEYVAISTFAGKADQWLGAVPATAIPWKNLVKAADRDAVAALAFADYKNSAENGAVLALAYARRSKEIGLKLVSDGVAATSADVNTVLLTGFFHAYGPVNEFVN